METKRSASKILSFLLTLCLILGMVPMTAFAEGETSLGDSGNATSTDIATAAFDELTDEVLRQGDGFGEITSQSALDLPGMLPGTDEDDVPIEGVTWQSEPEFDPEASEMYEFTPTLPEGGVEIMPFVSAGSTMDIGGQTGLDITTNQSGTGWDWNAGSDTLTLTDGYGGDSIDIQCGSADNITLLMTDDVTINTNSWWGISVAGNLTIKAGTHTLDVTASWGDAIACMGDTGLRIESGNVVATSGSGGITTNTGSGDIVITGSANVTATGFTDPTDPIWSFNGIQAANGAVLINTSGVVNATGGKGAIMAGQGLTIESGTVNANGGSFALLGENNGVSITGGTVTTNTTGSANGDIRGDLNVSGTASQVTVNGDVLADFSSHGGDLTVSDGTVTVTGTVSGNTSVTGGTVNVNGQTVVPVAQDLIVQGGNGGNGTSAGVGAPGTSNIQTLANTEFNSITVTSGNGGDRGSGNLGGAGGDAELTLTATTVTVSGSVLVRTGSDGDNNTGAWCGTPKLTVPGTLRAPSITVESTQNDADYRVYVNTLVVSDDTTITVSGLDAGGNCSFKTVNIADGKTLTVKNANGALVIGTIHFTGSGTGRIVIENSSRLVMDSLNFFHNAALDIPASTVGMAISSIDVSKGVVSGSVLTTPYTFSANGLPAGIDIDPATGIIFGTPTTACAAGTATITVTDKDQTSKSIAINYGEVSPTGSGSTEITGFAPIGDVSAGTAGSAAYADAAALIAALPTSVTANYSGGTVSWPVSTWVDTDTYDPATAGRYTFTATLGTAPAGYANSSGYPATVEVVVSASQQPTPLAVPAGLVWGGTTAKWDAVANAVGYKVQLYKGGSAVGISASSGTAAEYDFTSAIATEGAGSYRFKVQSIGDGTTWTDSPWSLESAAYAYTPGDTGTDITVDFTDPNFLAAVRSALGKGTADPIYDTDNFAAVTTLDVSSKNITSLAGIEHFTALTDLDCSYNQLSEINLSGLALLSNFDANNQTVTLTLTGSGSSYTTNISLNQPTGLANGLSYTGGVLTSNSMTIASSPFTVETGNAAYTLSGTLNLTYNTGGGTQNYAVNVTDGTASPASATAGTTVTLTANAALSGQRFKEWSITPSVSFVDGTSKNRQTVKFTMPNQAVTATAVYEAIPAGETVVTGVTLNQSTLSLYSNTTPGTATLTATVVPANATNQSVTWASGNTAVATVDQSGNVTAVGNGTAVITVTTTGGGYTALCTVTVSTYSSGSSSTGGGGSSSTPAPSITTDKKTDQPVIAKQEVKATVDKNGKATVSLTGLQIKALIDKATGTTADGIGVTVNATFGTDGKSTEIKLDEKALDLLVGSNVERFEVSTPLGGFIFDKAAIKEITSQATGAVTISMVPVTKLSDAAKALIGNRPVFDLTVSYVKDGKIQYVSTFGKGTVSLAIAYKAADGEKAGNLYGVYVDGNGKPQLLTNSSYDNDRVIFSRSSLSVYGVGYQTPAPSFTDTATHWAKDNIDFVVGRGLLSGTTATTFAPNTAITRADFLMALGKLSGADVSGYKTSSFTDVKSTDTAMPYIEWAVAKQIVHGIGDNQFGPKQQITREQMAVMMQNHAKAVGFALPISHQYNAFTDDSKISSWSKEAVKAIAQAGIIVGKDGGKFDPQGNATRAEAATILCRFVELVIGEGTTRG